FGPEAGRTGVLVHLIEAVARDAQAEADAVIAREVRGRFRRRANVVGGERVFGHRQADVDRFGARRLEPVDAALPQRFDLARHAVDAILPGNADPQAADVAGERALEIGHGER